MPGLMSGDWKRGTVSGPQRLQCDAWTAPDLSTTAPALDSTPIPPNAPPQLERSLNCTSEVDTSSVDKSDFFGPARSERVVLVSRPGTPRQGFVHRSKQHIQVERLR